MNDTGVHKIAADGTVETFAKASNSSAWAMHVWMTLAERCELDRHPDSYASLWALAGKAPLSVEESLVLVATFDAPWVRRANIPKLGEALWTFWKEHRFVRPGVSRFATVEVTPTILEVATHLARIHFDDRALGAAFHGTSTVADPWEIVEDEEDEEDEEGPVADTRRFVFGKDSVTRYGKPIEIFEYVASRRSGA